MGVDDLDPADYDVLLIHEDDFKPTCLFANEVGRAVLDKPFGRLFAEWEKADEFPPEWRVAIFHSKRPWAEAFDPDYSRGSRIMLDEFAKHGARVARVDLAAETVHQVLP